MSDINIGQITEALNDKTDRDLQNVDNTAGADAVIEYQFPTADNNYTWYRKYKSGWVEQGGFAASQDASVSLSVEMANTNYNVFVSVITSGKDNNSRYPYQVFSQTTTSLRLYVNCGTFVKTSWRVEGMAA